MSFVSLTRLYPQVDRQILKDYKDPDTYIEVNINDRDLIPILIKLPPCPKYHLIEGFGKPAREQKWQYPKMPKRLLELQKRFEVIDQVWDYLDKNQSIYKNEIAFIRAQWDRRLNGHWLFIHGKPTYIDGWHYFYCGWWNIDIGLPHFRDRDRRWFIAARSFYNEKREFLKYDENGWAIPDDDDEYEMIDTGNRLFYGFNYPKHRREGATYRAECINYEIVSRIENAWGGIQSMNDVQSKKAFTKHLAAPINDPLLDNLVAGGSNDISVFGEVLPS